MNKIKFSHWYSKLNGIDFSEPVILIRIEEIDNIKQLPENFLVYDTVYWKDGKKHYYPLKQNQKYIVLYFKDNKGLLFTTIRRYTPRKFQYYFENQGCEFEIILN